MMDTGLQKGSLALRGKGYAGSVPKVLAAGRPVLLTELTRIRPVCRLGARPGKHDRTASKAGLQSLASSRGRHLHEDLKAVLLRSFTSNTTVLLSV